MIENFTYLKLPKYVSNKKKTPVQIKYMWINYQYFVESRVIGYVVKSLRNHRDN